MQRITQENLERLTGHIAKATGKQYQVGQIYGLNWCFCTDTGHDILEAATKGQLYELMHAYFKGVQDTQAQHKVGGC